MVFTLLKKLKFIDYFGYSAGFKIDGKDYYQTILGGLLNILIFITFLAHFTINFIKYCTHYDPDIYSVEAIQEDPDIKFEFDNFLFSISLKVNGETYDLNKYFDPIIKYKTNSSNEISISFEDCNLIDFKTEIINKNSLNQTLCPIFFNNQTYHIKQLDVEHQNYFKFFLQFNKNNIDEAKELLNNNKSITVLSIGLRKNLFTPDNYNHPISHYIDYQDVILSNDKNSFIKINFGKTTVETTTINLLDCKFEEDSFGETKITQDFKIIKNSDKWLLGVFFYPDIFSKIYFRKYAWFDEIIGDAAVVASCVSTFLGFFYSFYSDFKFKSFMFRKLIMNYNFNDDTEDNKKINNLDSLSKIFTKKEENINGDNKENLLISKNDTINISDISEKEMVSKSNINNNSTTNLLLTNENDLSRRIAKTKRFDQLASQKIKTKWNYLSYLFSCLKKNKKKYNDIDNVAEKYESKFDIFFYLRRMRNVNLINNILLNEKQKNIIKMLSRKKSFESLEKENKNNNFNFLKNLSELNCNDEINRRIIYKFLKSKN